MHMQKIVNPENVKDKNRDDIRQALFKIDPNHHSNDGDDNHSNVIRKVGRVDDTIASIDLGSSPNSDGSNHASARSSSRSSGFLSSTSNVGSDRSPPSLEANMTDRDAHRSIRPTHPVSQVQACTPKLGQSISR